jgi:hypothetical protein
MSTKFVQIKALGQIGPMENIFIQVSDIRDIMTLLLGSIMIFCMWHVAMLLDIIRPHSFSLGTMYEQFQRRGYH